MVESAPDALVVADLDGRVVLVNRQTEALFGYAREELLGEPVEVLIPTRFHAAHQQHRAQFVAAPRTRPMGNASPLFGRRRDGSEFPVEISLSPLDDQDMSERLVISSIRDVSELQRVQAARAAAESVNTELRALQSLTDIALSHLALDELLAALLERVLSVMKVDHVAILLLEADGQRLMVRAARGVAATAATHVHIPLGQGFAGRIAATRAPLVVDDLSTFPTVGPFLRQTLRSVAGVPLLVEERLIGVVSVGSATPRRFIAADVKLLEQVADRMALAIDRARLLEAEQAARREAERERVRWQATMDSAPEFVITCDADLRITYVNPAYEGLRGSPADPSVPPEARAARYGLLTPDGAGFVPSEQRPLTRAVREGQPVRGVEMMHRSPTGEERLVVWEAAPMRTPQGTLLGAVAIGHDITERRQLEREREQARTEAEQQAAQLAATFEAMADGVAVFDVQGRVVRENAAQQRLLGLDAAPPNYADLPLSERMALFAARDEQGRLLGPEEGPLPRALRGEVVSGAETTDLRSLTLDGREVELNVSAAPLRDREGCLTGVVTIFRDQTERKRLERERAQQAEQLDRIFEGIADGVVVYDAQGRMARLNAAARRILGLDTAPSEYAQLPPLDRAVLYEARDEQGRPLTPDDWPLIRVLRGQVSGADAREVRLRMLDGRELEVTTSAAPLHDGAGRLVGAVTILHDQTEHKRLAREREEALRHSEAWFHTMADTAPVLLWVAGTDGLVTFVNEPWLQFTGRRLEDELGNGWAEGVHPDDYQRCLDTYLTAFHARERFTMEYRLRRFDGAYRWVIDSGVPRFDADGTFAGYIGSAVDVTEREQLKREREEALIGEQATREVNQRMRQFLAIASHDLRNPVTTALGTVQLTERRLKQLVAAATATSAAPASDVAQNPYTWMLANLATVNQALHRLNRLIGRLFDVTQAQTGHLELRMARHDLTTLVQAAVLAQRSASPGRAILLQIAPDWPVPVTADADRLDQVLTNYLTNAIKYSPADRPVEVHLEVEDDVQVRVLVRDQGPGLAPEEQEHVWEPFHRVPGMAVQSGGDGGLGLGLYLCKTLVERHGGRVGVDSAPGCGATFWFTLPLDHVSASTSAST